MSSGGDADQETPGSADDAAEPRRLRRIAHAEQKRIAQSVTGDWRSIRGFSIAQRRAAVFLTTVFLLCIGIGLLRNRSYVDDPLPAVAPRFDELADRLDPNHADVASLAALPQLGERRARDIVAFRDRARDGDPTRVVFSSIDDLMRVRGIGFALSRQMEPFLAFPISTTSQPAQNGNSMKIN